MSNVDPMNEVIDPVTGLTRGDMVKFVQQRKERGRRDARVCVCGHSGGAHFRTGIGGPGDISELPPRSVGCQAGKVPCACNTFIYVLRCSDVRSFIQKTEGPDSEHALAKGIASTLGRGIQIEWHPNLACMKCEKEPSEVGVLAPVAYNERGFEATRSTDRNMLICEDCRADIRAQATGVVSD